MLLQVNTFRMNEVEIKCKVCNAIFNKIEYILKEELFNSNDDMLVLSSVTRYLLETLISTEIMLKEKEYIYEIYYYRNVELKEKLKIVIKRIKKEIIYLQDFADEKDRRADWSNVNSDVLESIELNKEIEEEIYLKAKENITLIFEGVELNGFSFQKHIVEENILKKCEKDLDNISKEIEVLSEEAIFSDLFREEGINKKYKKYRKKSWHKKAKIVGLEDEYKYIYDFTSSLIHFSSYSIFTSNEFIDEEIDMMYSFILQYLERIHNNLIKLCGLDVMQFYKIIND